MLTVSQEDQESNHRCSCMRASLLDEELAVLGRSTRVVIAVQQSSTASLSVKVQEHQHKVAV
jgi:hypothetical protein